MLKLKFTSIWPKSTTSRGFKIVILAFISTFNIGMIFSYELSAGPLRDKINQRRAQNQERREKARAARDESIAKPGSSEYSISHRNRTRTYTLHIPATFSATKPATLILAFHGGGGNKDNFMQDDSYHLLAKSEAKGFLLAFPNGTGRMKLGKLLTWNAGRCCGYARDNQVDDVGFVKAMIEDIASKVSIERKRIFAIGFSNGGMMAYKLACDMADTFKAIGSVAGTDNVESCKPKNPVSVFHIHAQNDGHVLFNGGAGPGSFRNKSMVTEFRSVEDTIDQWKNLNHCKLNAERTLEKRGAYCDRYTCDAGTAVQLCVTESGGHSWPGAEKARLKADTPTTIISATDMFWDFFSHLP